MNLEGILPMNKPRGLTSHDVVARARRMLGLRRIGHTGTLDPEVSGVLPLCLGRATRMVEYIQDLPKEYLATLRIGLSTDTEDLTGRILEQAGHVHLREAEVRDAFSRFVGEIEQIPPMYSAVKVKGQKLYELARKGREVERRPRKVTILQLDILELDLTNRHPEIRFRVLCSKGTYIRTLCADIGKELGYPAVMANLVRTSAGAIRLEQCISLEQLEEAAANGDISPYLIPADRALPHLPACYVPPALAGPALKGQKLPLAWLLPDGSGLPGEGGLIRLYDREGPFLGIFRMEPGSGLVVPVKVFS